MAQSPDVTAYISIQISGVVQGVGFRPFVARLARSLDIRGTVRNDGGDVLIEAQGRETDIHRLLDRIEHHPPAGSSIRSIKTWNISSGLTGFADFTIVQSGECHNDSAMPTPDIALCDDCLEELFASGNPRFRNPFISCTACGPRFSIVNKLPYDRCNTSMEGFALCHLCDHQYHEESDRRYHAQTVCCNNCGPSLSYYSADSRSSGEEALWQSIRALKQGGIIAVKGIGGYHFACSPFEPKAVSALRILKGREHKPFAVMFPSLPFLQKNCEINKEEEKLLVSRERPIVLLNRRESHICEGVYGSSRYMGAFLPYTPLQQLILRETGPLVMTSANATSLPIIIDDSEMMEFFTNHEELQGVLTHDRAILRRLDDSVAAVIGGGTQFLRRARGYVPLSLTLPFETDSPAILACGPQQKNTVCLSKGGLSYPGTEIGDLDSRETLDVYRSTIEDMEDILNIRPELVAYDLHPLYESTKYALETGLPAMGIQHHFAHIASVMAEHHLTDPVIGVAFDGTGYGTDGTVWGGEFLIASPEGFRRAGHLKAVKLLGSDASVLQGWKTAACLRRDAGFPPPDDVREKTVWAALDADVNTILSSSMGRVFDGVSSLLGICHESDYDGQCAIELENAAARCHNTENATPLPYVLISDTDGITADLAPAIWALRKEKGAGEDPTFLAYRFHVTIGQMIVDMCKKVREESGISHVALSGGVFQNRLLLSLVLPALREAGFQAYRNEMVPPGDGGVSLGQAYIAGWAARRQEEK